MTYILWGAQTNIEGNVIFIFYKVPEGITMGGSMTEDVIKAKHGTNYQLCEDVDNAVEQMESLKFF